MLGSMTGAEPSSWSRLSPVQKGGPARREPSLCANLVDVDVDGGPLTNVGGS